MIDDSVSQYQIGKFFGVSQPTVFYHLKRIRNPRACPKTLVEPRKERKKLSPLQQRLIWSYPLSQKYISSLVMARFDISDVHVPAPTLSNELKNFGIANWKTLKKLWLEERQKEVQLECAKRYEDWSVDDWKQEMFPNEFVFQTELYFESIPKRIKAAIAAEYENTIYWIFWYLIFYIRINQLVNIYTNFTLLIPSMLAKQ